MDSSENELREQRAALLGAVNAKEWKAVKSFIHPDYSAGAILGLRLGRGFMIFVAKFALILVRGFREEVEIEEARIEGDRAELLVTRVDRGRILGVFPEKVDRRRYKETWEKYDGRWLFFQEDCQFEREP